MTTINRALHKAYKRRAESEPARETRRPAAPTVSGWASKLREPIKPLKRPLPAPPVSQTPSEQLPTSLNAVLSGGTKIRIDAGHSPTDSAPPPVKPTLAVPPKEDPAEPAAPWSWPPIVQLLLTCPAAAEIRDLAVQLRHLAADQDLRCVAFSGPGRKAGRTSLVLTLASVLIADKTTRVAIVDADFDHPDAARMISLQPASGLEEIIANPAPADGVATTLIAGRLAIVPLTKPVAAATIDNRGMGALQAFLRALRREYDLVLIDAGPSEFDGGNTEHPPLVLECRAVDALVCVCRDNSSQDERPIDEMDFRQPGIEWLGVVETFVNAPPLDSRHN